MVEENTVHRHAVNLRFFSGDGVVRNVVPDAPAIFEVAFESTLVDIIIASYDDLQLLDCSREYQ